MNDKLFSDDQHYTRRQALGLGAVGGLGVLGAGGLLGLAGCGGSSESSSSKSASAGGSSSFKGETLNLFTWSSYHEKPWLAEYEKSRGVKVNVQLYTSVPGGFAKVKADPSEFDLVLATSSYFENYVNAELIAPIDESKIPNLKNITSELDWRGVTEVNKQLYGIMYNWGDQSLCWLPGKTPTPKKSWRALYEPAYKGKVSIVDDPPTVMPFLPIMLGFSDPYHLTGSQFKQMEKALMELRGQITHVTESIEGQTADFANGDVVMGILYNPSTQDALKAEGIKLEHLIPTEGAPGWSDNYAMTKVGSEKSDLVYDFINYTLTVPWQARFAAESANTGNIPLKLAKSPEAVKAGLTTEKLNATILPETAAGKAFYSKIKIGKFELSQLEEWLNLWNEFKASL